MKRVQRMSDLFCSVILIVPAAHFSMKCGLVYLMVASYICAVCGETIETVIDESQGIQQEYIEDCQVCCRPNVLHVTIDPDTHTAEIASEFEE